MVFHLLNSKLYEALKRLGYADPTPAQREAIPAILQGRHVLLIAPTGYGKTEAALFPIFSKLIEEEGGGVRCLYITPLRSLNRDLLTRLRRIGEAAGLRIAVRHSDTTTGERKTLAKTPPDVLITTPESLQILLLHKR
ncbi:MAG: DEAD/DEAH box helicase, partial [Pyrobaculum sp.]